jgi:hypothetical protein
MQNEPKCWSPHLRIDRVCVLDRVPFQIYFPLPPVDIGSFVGRRDVLWDRNRRCPGLGWKTVLHLGGVGHLIQSRLNGVLTRSVVLNSCASVSSGAMEKVTGCFVT